MTRTLIIGLDGATRDEIKPLAIEGGLPTLTKLRETGENMKRVIRSIYWIIFPLLVETLKRSFRIVKEVVRR